MKAGLIVLFWVLGVIFIALVSFAVLQPFLWYRFFGEPPIQACETLSRLLSITIALVALGIGAFGWVTYTIVRDRLHEEVSKAAKEAAEKEYLIAIVRLNSHSCQLWGSLYEILMLTQEPKVKDWLGHFINYSVYYGKMSEKLTKRLDEETNKDIIMDAKNNFAMALALQGDQGKVQTAKELIDYLEKNIQDYPEEKRTACEETINFLRWRIPTKLDDCKIAKANFENILKSSPYKDSPRRRLLEKRWDNFFKPEGF